MESGAKRRQARRAEAISEYKELSRTIKEINRNDPIVDVQERIKNDLDRCNELYPIVKRKLDGTSVDARHMRSVLRLGQECSKRINASSKTFEIKKVLQNLLRDHRSSEHSDRLSFYTSIVDDYVHTSLLTPPSFEFFYGALKFEDLVIKERKKRATREQFNDTKAVTAQHRDVDQDVEQDTTPKEVEHIITQIKRLAKNKPKGIPFFQTIVDPNSFVHTVENIFHFSFLVKEGKVGLNRDEDSHKALVTVDDTEAENASQSILSFSMGDFRDWIAKNNISKRSFASRQNPAE